MKRSKHPHADRVSVRPVASRDKKQIVALAKESIALHAPWVTAPTSSQVFRLYLRRIRRDDHKGYVCYLKETKEIVGIFNLNNIQRGVTLSTSIGYYVFSRFQNKGYMTEGLTKMVNLAFHTLGLHRIEANIQPENEASKNLVQRCGFKFEGVSKDFLFINGRWRDHERWVIIDKRPELFSMESALYAG